MDIQHIVEEIGVSKTNLFKIMSSIAVRPKAKSNIVSVRLPSQLKTFATSFRRRRTLWSSCIHIKRIEIKFIFIKKIKIVRSF